MKIIKVIILSLLTTLLTSCGIEKRIYKKPIFFPWVYQNFGEDLQLIHLTVNGKPTAVEHLLYKEFIYESFDTVKFIVQGRNNPILSDRVINIEKIQVTYNDLTFVSKNHEKKFVNRWLFEDTPSNMKKFYDKKISKGRIGIDDELSYIINYLNEKHRGGFIYTFMFTDPIYVNDDLKIEVFYSLESKDKGSVVFEVNKIKETVENSTFIEKYIYR